jgi:hypothetical protein
VSGFAGVPFAFQKKQTIRFATALPILAAELGGLFKLCYFLYLIKRIYLRIKFAKKPHKPAKLAMF